MHKTKENLSHVRGPDDIPDPDALETEREERYEEIGGETSTEGLGRGYASGLEAPEIEDVQSADGPPDGEDGDPPVRPKDLPNPEPSRRELKHKGNVRGTTEGGHSAAHSSKAY